MVFLKRKAGPETRGGSARRTRRIAGGAAVAVAGLAVVASSGAAKSAGHQAASATTIRVAVVSNSNMINIEKLTNQFEAQNPGIKVKYDTLNENNERSLIETDVSNHANEFDVVMISNYETPIWAKNGWLVNLTPPLTADKSYDVSDLLKPIASSLSYKNSIKQIETDTTAPTNVSALQ